MSKKELGFFTNEHEKAYAELIDEALKLKGLAEWADGWLARIAISAIDNELVEKYVIQKYSISAEVITQVHEMNDLVLAKDFIGASSVAATLANTFINIPGLSEDDEALMFTSFFNMLVAGIEKKAKAA